MRTQVILVDASIYIFRAWHSLPDDWQDGDGESVNAVHGFLRFLLELLERERPSHVAVAFDEALQGSFRNALYPAYKANREPAPEPLKRQFAKCRALCDALGLHTLAHPEFEADDLIGSLLRQVDASGWRGLIVSADKDLSQLLHGDHRQWDFARDLRWDADGVPARYGVRAEQIPDFLGLSGDAVDNIPGVPGIGAKTASALLAAFGSLEAILAQPAAVRFMSMRGAARAAAALATHADQARLSKRLATIACGVEVSSTDCRRRQFDSSTLEALLAHWRIGPMTRRRISALPAVSG